MSCFSPRDDSIVAIGMDNSTIVIYNLHSDEVTWKLEGHAKRVTSLAFSNTLNTKRNTPLTGSSGVLKLSSPGILVPVDHKNTTGLPTHQSFDYPGDTLIPGMKLVRNKITCFNWHLTLWKNPQDPSQGHYAYQLGPYGYHKLILREGSVIKYRTAPWNGIQFSGMHNLNPTYDFVLDNDDEVYYGYKLLNSSTLFRLALIQDGFGLSYIGSDGNQGWVVYLRATTDICDKYGISGPNGACNIDKSPVCSCLKGFIPNFQQDWDLVEWSYSCVRKSQLNCSGDIFIRTLG
ncbi:PREDICTED: G-type lectin S-receptor [Prunus dulcis]|uniref:PREDICTED: G-type lectin S-receptor n=1 Tax=Prunus dulcis TaxID=3755 RepID=A0A5E4EAK0_PRUDU|nr:PREDICTED: G-type lectin S-receptor [Prunus dulcis]